MISLFLGGNRQDERENCRKFLDDIDDDIRKNRFSPFKVYHSHKILVEQNYMVIDEFLSTINKQHLEKIYKGFSDSYEDIILKSFLENTIPLTTERILTK